MRFVSCLVLLALVAAQPRWSLERSRLATILFGITYVDEFNGFVQGAQDGSGPLILRSRNGGSNYESVSHSGSTLMFMSGTAHTALNAAAGGVGILSSGIQYTQEGSRFQDASLPIGFPPVGASQSGAAVRDRANFRDGAFGFVGMFSGVEGVAFTGNGGSSWRIHPIPNAPSQVRYGAYPSMTTWYVSGGTWPDKKQADHSHFAVSEHIITRFNNETAGASVDIISEASTSKNGYVAFISKTVDGGATWTRVFFQESNFYFNGIDCIDVNNCFVVAEGSDGAYLFATADAGATWQQAFMIPGRAASLFDVKYVGNREAWACGGILDFAFTGQFYHTVDAGRTWTPNPFPGVYGTTLTFAPVAGGYHGHATALTFDGQSSTLVYK